MPSSAWFLSLLAAFVVVGYADHSAHGISNVGRSADGSNVRDQMLQKNRDNRYSFDRVPNEPPRRPSELYLLNLFNDRSAKVEPLSFHNKAASVDTPRDIWSQPQLQLLSRPTAQIQSQVGSDDAFPLNKREGHSLSIVNPLDVLRQRMMLEMARRKMKENQEQIKANDRILKTLGKRRDGRDESDCDEEEENGVTKRRVSRDERRRSQGQDYLDSQQVVIPDEFVV